MRPSHPCKRLYCNALAVSLSFGIEIAVPLTPHPLVKTRGAAHDPRTRQHFRWQKDDYATGRLATLCVPARSGTATACRHVGSALASRSGSGLDGAWRQYRLGSLSSGRRVGVVHQTAHGRIERCGSCSSTQSCQTGSRASSSPRSHAVSRRHDSVDDIPRYVLGSMDWACVS